ncbi:MULTISPECIES: RNA polymerase sigma-70 factor [unclassified Saccharicrinis]|uniref:RNA polymerase sigma-70 factor n=1 Tax=unclassified Saccharicrinis TaxID=2646859 RepID=UPI003D346085
MSTEENFKITDRGSYKRVFNLFYKALTLFAIKYVNDKDDREDLVQETFVALWESRNQLRSESAIKSYLYTTLRNKCLNYLRHADTVNKYAENFERDEYDADFSNEIIKQESLRLFYQAIEQLNDNAKKVVLMTLEGYKRDEIAEQMDLSIDTIKYHKKTALQKLKEILGENFYLLMLLS